MVDDDNKASKIQRALIFQGGGSLGAYEAGSYKAINDELSEFIRNRQVREKKQPILFHIVSGTSIGAINAALLVSYVKENRTWEGSGQRLIDFWEYLSSRSNIEDMNPYFTYYWDFWNKMDKHIASGESARRYYSTKDFIFNGVPNVFKPKIPKSDTRFFDPSNTWYVYDNKPLKESLEKFAKFPISTSFENGEPRLLLVAVDVQDATPLVFDSYEKEDGTRKTGYGRYGPFEIERYGELEFDAETEHQNSSSGDKWDFEHVIRYNDGIKSEFVLASCSVPVNFDYTGLNVENPKLATGGLNHESSIGKIGSDRSSSSCSSSFKYSDKSNVSDYQMLAKSLIRHAEDNGVSRQSLQKILKHSTKTVIHPTTGPKRLLYEDLLKTSLDVDVTFRLERKNDTHTISNKTFDFSTTTIRQLIQDGYEETKSQMKRILRDTDQ
jgi:NTE family protein